MPDVECGGNNCYTAFSKLDLYMLILMSNPLCFCGSRNQCYLDYTKVRRPRCWISLHSWESHHKVVLRHTCLGRKKLCVCWGHTTRLFYTLYTITTNRCQDNVRWFQSSSDKLLLFLFFVSSHAMALNRPQISTLPKNPQAGWDPK